MAYPMKCEGENAGLASSGAAGGEAGARGGRAGAGAGRVGGAEPEVALVVHVDTTRVNLDMETSVQNLLLFQCYYLNVVKK